MRILFFFFFSVFLSLQTTIAQESNDIGQEIFFATASAELDEAALEKLTLLVEQIKELGDYRLEVAAYTDSRGSATYNETLALSRAQSVINYLEAKYIAADQMEVKSFGERLAGNDSNSEASMQQNRRVDIHVQGWKWDNIGSIQDSLSQSMAQEYDINAQEDQLITGSKGGQFFIPANSFVDVDGQTVEGLVNVNLTECYTIGDMISMGLTTKSLESILESGGMFNITATKNQEKLYLKEGAEITASVPTNNFRDNMSVFLGDGHDQNTMEENSLMDWTDTQSPVSSKLPQLRIAKGPKRPIKASYSAKFRKPTPEEIEELFGMNAPASPAMSRPRRPREPDYDRIAYRPRGLEKVLVGKQEREDRTKAMQEEKRLNYEERLAKYEVRKPVYDSIMLDYKQAVEAYEAKRARLVDENGYFVEGTEIFAKLQAMEDIAYEQARVKYTRDSTAYEGYRQRKIRLYEDQLEAFAIVDKQVLSKYFLQVNRLGWANIDRFLKNDLPTTMLAAMETGANSTSDAMVFVTFPERNIILRMKYNDGQVFNLPTVPLGEKANIIAMKVKDQKAYFTNQEVFISQNMVVDLDYKPGRLKDIRLALAAL